MIDSPFCRLFLPSVLVWGDSHETCEEFIEELHTRKAEFAGNDLLRTVRFLQPFFDLRKLYLMNVFKQTLSLLSAEKTPQLLFA